MKDKRTLGERVRDAIRQSGKSAAEVSREVGVTGSATTQWESGQTKNIRPVNLFKLARAVGKSPEWLATGEGPELAPDVRGGMPDAELVKQTFETIDFVLSSLPYSQVQQLTSHDAKAIMFMLVYKDLLLSGEVDINTLSGQIVELLKGAK